MDQKDDLDMNGSEPLQPLSGSLPPLDRRTLLKIVFHEAFLSRDARRARTAYIARTCGDDVRSGVKDVAARVEAFGEVISEAAADTAQSVADTAFATAHVVGDVATNEKAMPKPISPIAPGKNR